MGFREWCAIVIVCLGIGALALVCVGLQSLLPDNGHSVVRK